MTTTTVPIEQGRKSSAEKLYSAFLLKALQEGRIPDAELIGNIHVFLKRQQLARLLTLNEIYQQILDIPGAIVQCGVRWGGDMITFSSLRTLYEPFNYSRRLIGFDTFEGLMGTGERDQGDVKVEDGQYNVTVAYEHFLEELLLKTEEVAPIPHIQKFQLIRGDASQTVPEFLAQSPGEMIAMLYLDMDIYQPTRDVLDACLERLLPGALVVFDEYGSSVFPGEAQVHREFASKLNLQMRRSPFSTVTAYGIKQ